MWDVHLKYTEQTSKNHVQETFRFRGRWSKGCKGAQHPLLEDCFKRVYGLGLHMGGCQDYGPFLGTLNIRGRIIIGNQKGTIILTTTHIRDPSII